MLKRAHRLVNPLDFKRVVRRGERASGKFVTVHVSARTPESNNEKPVVTQPARVGFVVSKAVGSAVVRNHVKRRLRAIMGQVSLTPGDDLVVRALPRSASATYLDLETELIFLVGKTRR